MTSFTLIVGSDGVARNRNGKFLGYVENLTMELTSIPPAGERGVGGNGEKSSETATAQRSKENTPTGGSVRGDVDSAVQEVWDHYVQTFNATRQDLNKTRRRIIRNALKVRSVAECKRAIDGLAHSPYHNGQNDQRKKYLDIRYALRGDGSKGESVDERIDSMGERAPVAAGMASADDATVRRLLEDVRATVQTGAERERGTRSKERLEEMGFRVRREGQRVWIER